MPNIRLDGCQEIDAGIWRPDEATERHLVRSLRMRPGDAVVGLSHDSAMRYPLILDERGGSIVLRLVAAPSADRDRVKLTVLLALLKTDQFEAALRSLGELGAAEVIPIACGRSVPRIDEAGAEKKLARWRRLLDESTKVSGTSVPPRLHEITPFDHIEWDLLPERRFAAIISDLSLPIADAARIEGERALAVGPEGDWTEAETAALISHGFVPISLGSAILRASTAVTVAAAFMMLSGR